MLQGFRIHGCLGLQTSKISGTVVPTWPCFICFKLFPLPGDDHILLIQMGWFNHQLEKFFKCFLFLWTQLSWLVVSRTVGLWMTGISQTLAVISASSNIRWLVSSISRTLRGEFCLPFTTLQPHTEMLGPISSFTGVGCSTPQLEIKLLKMDSTPWIVNYQQEELLTSGWFQQMMQAISLLVGKMLKQSLYVLMETSWQHKIDTICGCFLTLGCKISIFVTFLLLGGRKNIAFYLRFVSVIRAMWLLI